MKQKSKWSGLQKKKQKKIITGRCRRMSTAKKQDWIQVTTPITSLPTHQCVELGCHTVIERNQTSKNLMGNQSNQRLSPWPAKICSLRVVVFLLSASGIVRRYQCCCNSFLSFSFLPLVMLFHFPLFLFCTILLYRNTTLLSTLVTMN